MPTGTTSIDGTWNGDCASTHQSGSYARFYAFTLTRRTQVQIDLRSAADAYLYLLRGAGSGGSIVDEDDDGGSTGNNSLLDLTLEAGTYTVEAQTSPCTLTPPQRQSTVSATWEPLPGVEPERVTSDPTPCRFDLPPQRQSTVSATWEPCLPHNQH